MTEYQKEKFDWWRDKLAGKDVPIHDIPMQGYYAFKANKKAVPDPVALWYSKQGELLCTLGSHTVDGVLKPKPYRNGAEIWVSILRNPISHDVFKSVVAGEPWPNEIRIEMPDGGTDSSMAGHNSGDDETTMLGNLKEWQDQIKKALKKGTPENKAEADALSDLATKLNDLAGEADDKRMALTKPHRDAETAINTVWMPTIKDSKQSVKDAKAAVLIWIDAEDKRRRAEAKKIQDEANAKAAAEAKAAREAGESVQDLVPEPVQVKYTPVSAGTRKSVVAVTTTSVVFDDIKATMAHFAEMGQDMPEKLYLELEATTLRLLRAGAKIPGARTQTGKGAR